MPDFSMKVTGSTRVANNMRTRAANAKNTYPITYAWAQKVRAKLKSKPYPPKRMGQKYIRTGQLANRWKVAYAGKNSVSIVNEAEQRGRKYATYVVGDSKGSGQAWMHKGRWWLARPVIDDEIPELKDDITEHVVDV